jgi:transcriptional regulator with XRE-family HTH domain
MGRRTAALEQADRLIGKAIRLQRLMRDMSRAKLASAIGVSEQQLQKYEAGVNRVSASRLFQISRVLGVSISAFFDGLEAAEATRVPKRTA